MMMFLKKIKDWVKEEWNKPTWKEELDEEIKMMKEVLKKPKIKKSIRFFCDDCGAIIKTDEYKPCIAQDYRQMEVKRRGFIFDKKEIEVYYEPIASIKEPIICEFCGNDLCFVKKDIENIKEIEDFFITESNEKTIRV